MYITTIASSSLAQRMSMIETWRTNKCQEMSLKLNDASDVFVLKMFLVDM